MEHVVQENVAIKREINKFLNRFFYSREKTEQNLALMYFYFDDFARYINEQQLLIANELLAHDNFKQVFLEKEGIKVFYDEELQTILIDSITQQEKTKLTLDKNKKYTDSCNRSC